MPETQTEPIKQPVPVQDVYNVYEVAELLSMSKNKVWKLARRSQDPLPMRRLPGQRRGSIALRDELLDWAKRNYTEIGAC